MISFSCNVNKVLQSILWVIDHRQGVTRHTLVKILYYADKKHLLNYGRPVTGDNYAKMAYGPVPSSSYNLINGDPIFMEALGLDELPFTANKHKLFSEVQPDLSLFSPSDIEALEESFDENVDLSFDQLVAKTHAEPEYKNADHWMRYEDFFEGIEGKEEIVADLSESSRSMVI